MINSLVKQKQYDALPSTVSLSRYYKRIIEKLLEYTATPLENLKAAAHHSLGDVLLRSPNDCYRFVKSTIQILIGMLRDEVGGHLFYPESCLYILLKFLF